MSIVNKIEEFLTENKTVELGTVRLEAVSRWLKKKLSGVAISKFAKIPNRGILATCSLEGAHGHLCSSYTIAGVVWDASSDNHPDIVAVRLSLNWKYKKLGENSHDIGTIFLNLGGGIVQEL